MIWVVDDQEIDVLVGAKPVVEVLRWNEYKKTIQVPVNMSNTEAVWTIRNLLKANLSYKPSCAVERLEVFDKSWPMKVLPKKKVSYMEDGIVHCYGRRGEISAREKIKIKEELLRQFVLRCVGQWEEMLELLIPHITFRKHKNSPYNVQRQKEYICFDLRLYTLPLEVIAYAVFDAVAHYGELEEDKRKRQIEKYFPRWKTLEKMIAYAYTPYDNH